VAAVVRFLCADLQHDEIGIVQMLREGGRRHYELVA
jgi:hypothetical protein